jgi:hypothetical protein
MTFIEKVALQVRSANQKGKKEGQVGELGLRDFYFLSPRFHLFHLLWSVSDFLVG